MEVFAWSISVRYGFSHSIKNVENFSRDHQLFSLWFSDWFLGSASVGGVRGLRHGSVCSIFSLRVRLRSWSEDAWPGWVCWFVLGYPPLSGWICTRYPCTLQGTRNNISDISRHTHQKCWLRRDMFVGGFYFFSFLGLGWFGDSELNLHLTPLVGSGTQGLFSSIWKVQKKRKSVTTKCQMFHFATMSEHEENVLPFDWFIDEASLQRRLFLGIVPRYQNGRREAVNY